MKNIKILKGVDIFKLMAAFGVVATHTDLPLFKRIGDLCVPFFAIVSSYFFFKHYLKLKSNLEQKKFVKKFVKRILFLFLTWEVFYIPLALKYNLEMFRSNGGLNINSIWKFIINFVYPVHWQAPGNGWGPSWYLIAIMLGIPVFVLFFKLFKGNLFILGIISFFIEIYYIAAFGYGLIKPLSIVGVCAFPKLIIYIFLGLLLAKYNFFNTVKNLRFYTLLSVIFVLLTILENYLMHDIGLSQGDGIMIAPTSFLLVLLSLQWEPTVRNTIEIRKFSTFLYCFQAWPLFISSHIQIMLNINSKLSNVFSFSFVIITALVAFELYKWVYLKTNWKFFSYMV